MKELIVSKADLKNVLDMEVVNKGVKAKILRLLGVGERNLLDKHQIFLRKTEYYHNTNKRIFEALYKWCLVNLQNKYLLHVPINCCGKGLKIMHLGPLLINQNAIIGDNSTFHFNNAVVAKGTDNGVPVIGDNVVFGSGAVAIGGIKIADYVAIGSNSVVCKSVLEENIAVAGVPAEKINNHGSRYW